MQLYTAIDELIKKEMIDTDEQVIVTNIIYAIKNEIQYDPSNNELVFENTQCLNQFYQFLESFSVTKLKAIG